MRASIPRLLILLLLASLAGGCGGSGSAAADLKVPEGFNACDILTWQKARAIAGVPIAGLSSTLEDALGPDPLFCSYNAGTVESPRLVSLQVRPAPSARAAERRIESNRSFLRTLSGGEVKDVAGIGEKAIWAGGTANQLHVSHGAVQLIITVQAGKNHLAAAQQIAKETFAAIAKAAQEGKPPQRAALE